MPKFIYRAKKGLDETREGVVEAESREDALGRLVSEGLFPVFIEPSGSPSLLLKTSRPKKKSRILLGRFFRKKINPREILIFTQKLTTLAKAKVELLASLKVLYEQTENERFKEIVLELYNSTKEGKTFSESLGRFPRAFSPLYVNIVRSGEESGHLDTALAEISEFMAREQSLKTKILVAMAYPALLLGVGLVSIFVLINFVIPKLKPIFESLGTKLPLATKIILKISVISNKSWMWIVLFFAITATVLYYQKGTIFFDRILQRIKTHTPVIKRLVRNQELTHFARSLGLLLNSGVSALKSLEIAALTIESPGLKNELRKVYQEVAQGQSISKSMEAFTRLPGFFIKMVAVGEESGRLGEVLEEISRSYTEQLESDVSLINSLIEPILILGLGLVLGAIVLSILLPTFQATQIVR